jgi:hypothetical protein
MEKSLTTTGTPHHSRPLTPPTDRDLHIYKLVKIQLREQWEVAQDHQIDASRVSQIITRVNRWLAAGGDPADPILRDHAAQQRLNTGMLKLRLARAVELASYALEFPQPAVTTKTRYHGPTEFWREETTRDAPKLSLPALRTLLDASQAIQKLDIGDKAPQPSQPSDDEVLHLVSDLLLGLRHRAESQGRLPPAQDHRAAISQTLSTLLALIQDDTAPTNAAPTTLNLEPGTLNSLPTPSSPSRDERETSESISPTALPEATCEMALESRSSEMSAPQSSPLTP